MKKIRWLFLFCLILIGHQNLQAQKSATIKGVLKNFPSITSLEVYGDLQLILPDSYDIKIVARNDNTFSVTVPLTEPEYFRLGRNKLYLSPGDNLEVYLDYASSASATFKGKGSEANDYLKTTLFPQAGSYIEAGKNIKPTPEETYQYVLDESKKREKQLEALTNVSDDFKRIERARIQGDIFRSFETVEIYGKQSSKIPPESRAAYLKRFNEISKNLSDSIANVLIDPIYLQAEVCRHVSSKMNVNGCKDPVAVQYYNDYRKSIDLTYAKLPSLKDKSKLAEYKSIADSIKTERFRTAVHKAIEDKKNFGNGDAAIDLTLKTTDGKDVNLSSLKGKVIYIDIWATWCAPCMAELPNLEILKKKHEGDDRIAIVSISVDDKIADWKKSLDKRKPAGIQWRIDRAELSSYRVTTIPRYILIDKDFRVVEMDAGMPSDKATQVQIEQLLKK
jgi:thiol-disulfide isomerase/thioredoxin